MPIQFYNLAWNLYHSENAQAIQNLFQNAQEASNYAATIESMNRAKQDTNEQIRGTTTIENSGIESESKGAHSHELTKEEEEKEKKEKNPSLPDPYGRGSTLDVKF